MSEQIVTVDIGGTHARFALAGVEGGRVVSLGDADDAAYQRPCEFPDGLAGF